MARRDAALSSFPRTPICLSEQKCGGLLAILSRSAAVSLTLFCLYSARISSQTAGANAASRSSRAECVALQGMEIPATALGLPTTGAGVNSAKLVCDKRGEYCKILGRIHPVDPAAQDIRFEVNLPSKWNRKAVQFGGGAFDGWLGATNGLNGYPVTSAGDAAPLARGFATFGGDSGHHKRYFLLPDATNALNASFALNPEMRRNFASDGLKKTHDAAVAIIARRFGEPPSRMFFLGGSTGGREAFFVVQRWPQDYDGVLGAYAGWDQIELDLQFIRVSQAVYSKGGFLPPSKTKLLAHSVMNACDALDGLSDGIIANVNGCQFDPQTLLCSAGKNGKNCLTPQELKTVQTFASEQRTAEPLRNGVQTMPGFNVLAGTDLTGSMGLLHHAEHPPKFILNSFYYLVGDQVLRFFLTGDRHFNALTFDTSTGGKYSGDLLPHSKASDASDADLTPFAKHGGKFLIVHGTADATIPTNASVLYYQMVQGKMSQEEIDKFLRFYLIPGFGHGRGVFDAGFDALGVLDRWLDTNVPPQNLVVIDNNKQSRGRTRPLCEYPSWPKYKGSGDANVADSFVCTTEQ
jgi:Tannase and feruloyl esterase